MSARLDELGLAELCLRLGTLHERGVVNESAFLDVLQELGAGRALTQDHLIQIFGVGPTYHLLTIPDETARQLVREAFDAFTNPETQVDLRDWIRSAKTVVGPIDVIRRVVSETADVTEPGA